MFYDTPIANKAADILNNDQNENDDEVLYCRHFYYSDKKSISRLCNSHLFSKYCIF